MKILVGYDGSNSSLNAIKIATVYAKAFNAMIFVATSLYGNQEGSQENINKVEKQLEDAETLIRNEGVACERHLLIRANSPGEDIVIFAKEHHVDQIIIGVRRRSKIGKLIFGSNAQYIILNADCPVVTVR
jgi:nucleotide-binding universal stress UspA family protein